MGSIVENTKFNNLLNFYKQNNKQGDPVKYGDMITLMSVDVSYNQKDIESQDNYFLSGPDSNGISKNSSNLVLNKSIDNKLLFSINSSDSTKNLENITYGDWNITLQHKESGEYMGSWGGGTNQWNDYDWANNVKNGAQYHFSPVSKAWSNTNDICYGDVIQIGSASTDGTKNIEQILSTGWVAGEVLATNAVDTYTEASQIISTAGNSGYISPVRYWMLWSNPRQLLTEKSGRNLNFPLFGNKNINVSSVQKGAATFSTTDLPSPSNTFWIICRSNGISPYDTNVANRYETMIKYCGQKNTEHDKISVSNTIQKNSSSVPECRNSMNSCIGYNQENDMAWGCRNLYKYGIQCQDTTAAFKKYCRKKCGRNLDDSKTNNPGESEAPQGGIIGQCDNDPECSCIDYINSKKYKDTYIYLSTNSSVNKSESVEIQKSTALKFVNQPAKCWFTGCTSSDAGPTTNGFYNGNDTKLFLSSSWAGVGSSCPTLSTCNSINIQICNGLNAVANNKSTIGDIYSNINCTQNNSDSNNTNTIESPNNSDSNNTNESPNNVSLNTTNSSDTNKILMYSGIVIGSIIVLVIILKLVQYFIRKNNKVIATTKFSRRYS